MAHFTENQLRSHIHTKRENHTRYLTSRFLGETVMTIMRTHYNT